MKQRSPFLRDSIALIPRHGHRRLNLLTDILNLTRSLGLTLLGAGAVFLLRQLSPDAISWVLSPRPPHRSRSTLCLTVPGLRNAGNNCFLNAVLQALASSEVLLAFLGAYDKEKMIALFPSVEESCPTLPLSEALADLLGELSCLTSKPFVASPRHVMLALEQYAKQFSLSSQQDAAEALAHLIDALQKERSIFYESFRAYKDSLSCTSGYYIDENPMKRIIEGDSKKEASPLYSWKQQFRFPIAGSMGSMLTCLKCGFQFSTQFQSFYDVSLPPPQWPDGTIIDECRLQICLEQFTAPECISNVRCSRCSHTLILSLLKQRAYSNKVLMQRIEQCTFGDDCSCEDLVKREGEVWRNVYVNALKQLRFGQCPEVLCCQVQRVVITRSGQLIKSTHRVSFPSVLDLSPYTMSSYSKEKYSPLMTERKHSWQRSGEMCQNNESSFYNMPRSSDGLNSDDIHLSACSGSEDLSSDSSESKMGQLSEGIVSVGKLSSGHFQVVNCDSLNICKNQSFYGVDNVTFTKIKEILTQPDCIDSVSRKFQSFRGSTLLFEPGLAMQCATGVNEIPMTVVQKSVSTTLSANSGMKDNQISDKLAAKNQFEMRKSLYGLISVVVHSGSPKAGHYTVYRRAKLTAADIQDIGRGYGSPELSKVEYDETEKTLDPDSETILWFRVSDAHVDLVSEDDVLRAQASLLFYERLHEF